MGSRGASASMTTAKGANDRLPVDHVIPQRLYRNPLVLTVSALVIGGNAPCAVDTIDRYAPCPELETIGRAGTHLRDDDLVRKARLYRARVRVDDVGPERRHRGWM